jgi:hypothetical protein
MPGAGPLTSQYSGAADAGIAHAPASANARIVRRHVEPGTEARPADVPAPRARAVSGTATQDANAVFQRLRYELFKVLSLRLVLVAGVGARVRSPLSGPRLGRLPASKRRC